MFDITYRVAPIAQEWDPFRRFVELASSVDYLLFDKRDRHLLEPDFSAVIVFLRSPRAVQFAVDPESTIVDSVCDETAKPTKPTDDSSSP